MIRACRLVAGVAVALSAATAAAQEISTTKDLTAVIALQGKPCGEVVTVDKRGDRDYVATCKDGNRYRVYVNAQGRVVVDKQ